ncbi:MAG: SCP2 domain-containing protein [Stellaceae bacterium]
MEQTGLPAPFARRAMMLMPPPVLRHGIRVLMRRMERRHPRLFDNLARMEAATIRIEPLDLPHRFLLRVGEDHPRLQWLDEANAQAPATAMVKGKLQALLDLLEGRSDSDAMFFRRDIVIGGDTSVVVALRNALDRDPLDLFEDVTSIFGSFAALARRAIVAINRAAGGENAGELQEWQARTGRMETECGALREEVNALKARLAKLEVRRAKQGEAAA